MIYALLLLVAAPSDAFTGKVTAITDGDSIKVLRERTEVTIRLEGIDCPELGQAFGRQAKQQTSDLSFGKMVYIQVKGKDRYGRTLANVTLPDGSSLNSELVRSGYAWWFRKYSEDQELQRFEAEAKANERGLWADPQPVAPWNWRAAQRSKPDLPPNKIAIVANGVSILALLPNPAGDDAGSEQVTIGNSTDEAVYISGWKLIDKAGNVFLLSGSVEPKKSLVLTMTETTMPLNNNGDTVVMIDMEGVGRSRVSYSASQVRSGHVIRFEE